MKIHRLALLVCLAACGGKEWAGPGDDGLSDASAALAVPSFDRPDTVDVGSWNLEWFGDPRNGPTDEAQQQANAATVLRGTDLDLVGLVEVVSEKAFTDLLAKLPNHDGILVTDPRVVGGQAEYSPTEQKVALLFHRRFTVESARVVLTEARTAFAGRPPMEVKLKFTEGGKARSLTVVVSHFKAMANADGWQRRVDAAKAMRAWLGTEYPTRWVLVVGDFNDDLDQSTYRGHPSPFADLVADPEYRFTTDALSASNTSTTVHFGATIDHHLATNELATRFVEGSAQVLRVDQYIGSYGTTTSDHYPVLTRYDLR
jgi:endonuclease/exonuclease/phosphatase family metal-dependent hydrolase